MPHHKSAKKRVRTNEQSRRRNIAVKSEVRSVTRTLREKPSGEGATELLREAHSAIDNAVRKGILQKTAANRRKSRLAKLVNRASKKPAKS